MGGGCRARRQPSPSGTAARVERAALRRVVRSPRGGESHLGGACSGGCAFPRGRGRGAGREGARRRRLVPPAAAPLEESRNCPTLSSAQTASARLGPSARRPRGQARGAAAAASGGGGGACGGGGLSPAAVGGGGWAGGGKAAAAPAAVGGLVEIRAVPIPAAVGGKEENGGVGRRHGGGGGRRQRSGKGLRCVAPRRRRWPLRLLSPAWTAATRRPAGEILRWAAMQPRRTRAQSAISFRNCCAPAYRLRPSTAAALH